MPPYEERPILTNMDLVKNMLGWTEGTAYMAAERLNTDVETVLYSTTQELIDLVNEAKKVAMH